MEKEKQEKIRNEKEKMERIEKLKTEKLNKIKMEKIEKEKKEKEETEFCIALYNFEKENEEEISIKKNEYLVVLDWNHKDGWVYCYKYNNRNIKGIVPKLFVRKCDKPQIG